MDLISLIEAGATSPLALLLAALLLGALHGLEPGHAKTMMAAFIIAVRGTPAQAALLGISAALSHTVIVWVLAILALVYGDALIGGRLEPWFMISSGAIVVLMGVWICLRGRHDHHHHHHHHHHHPHDHHHAHEHGHEPEHDHPHVHATGPGAHAHVVAPGQSSTTAQTILFGLTGGMIPCPAAITVLMLCLHLKKFSLGIALVAAFSIGLALTLVAVGMVTAIGLRYAAQRTTRLDALFAKAPWISAALISLIGLFMAWSGYARLATA